MAAAATEAEAVRSQGSAMETAELAQRQIKAQEGVQKLSEANGEPQKALRLL